MATSEEQKQRRRQQQMLYFVLIAQIPQLVYDIEDARGPGSGPAKKVVVMRDLERLATTIAPESARTPKLIKWIDEGVDIFVADANSKGLLSGNATKATETGTSGA